jgi:hypothetical protein
LRPTELSTATSSISSRLPDAVLCLSDFRQATFTFFAVLIISGLDLGLFRCSFALLVPDEGSRWVEDGLVEFLEFISVIFGTESVVL